MRSKLYRSGLIFMAQSAVCFSIMALFVKCASQTLSSFEIVFFRSLLGTAITAGVMVRKKISFLGKQRKLMFFRGLSGFLALTLHFYTIQHLPLGTAVLLNYTAPILVALLAILFLKERPSLTLIALILFSFGGVYLLAQGGLKIWTGGVFLGLLSAVFAAVAYILIRLVKYKESPLTIMIYFTGISTVGSLFLLGNFEWPDAGEWFYLGIVGIASFYGQLWMTIAFRRAPASLLTPISYLTPVLSFFYGVLFFKDPLTRVSIAGAGVIIVCGCLISFLENKVAAGSPEKPTNLPPAI